MLHAVLAADGQFVRTLNQIAGLVPHAGEGISIAFRAGLGEIAQGFLAGCDHGVGRFGDIIRRVVFFVVMAVMAVSFILLVVLLGLWISAAGAIPGQWLRGIASLAPSKPVKSGLKLVYAATQYEI